MDFIDQCIVDLIEMSRKFFRTATRSEMTRQGLSEHRKTGNVSKQLCSLRPVGQGLSARKSVSSIHWQISAEDVYFNRHEFCVFSTIPNCSSRFSVCLSDH